MQTSMPSDLHISGEAIPMACVPAGIPAAEREAHFALVERLVRAAPRTDIPGGYAFTFAASAFDDVALFVGNERRCCPFLKFDIELAPSEGPLTLRLTGPQGTRVFLDAEMRLTDMTQ